MAGRGGPLARAVEPSTLWPATRWAIRQAADAVRLSHTTGSTDHLIDARQHGGMAMNQGKSVNPRILRNALHWFLASVMFRSSDSNSAARAGHSAYRDGHSETD